MNLNCDGVEQEYSIRHIDSKLKLDLQPKQCFAIIVLDSAKFWYLNWQKVKSYSPGGDSVYSRQKLVLNPQQIYYEHILYLLVYNVGYSQAYFLNNRNDNCNNKLPIYCNDTRQIMTRDISLLEFKSDFLLDVLTYEAFSYSGSLFWHFFFWTWQFMLNKTSKIRLLHSKIFFKY